MQATEVNQRLSWMNSDLYKALASAFPELRTEQQKVLDIVKLGDGTHLSRECIYKWLRAGRILSPAGATKLFDFANSPENLAALERAGRPAPTKDYFARFLLP